MFRNKKKRFENVISDRKTLNPLVDVCQTFSHRQCSIALFLPVYFYFPKRGLSAGKRLLRFSALTCSKCVQRHFTCRTDENMAAMVYFCVKYFYELFLRNIQWHWSTTLWRHTLVFFCNFFLTGTNSQEYLETSETVNFSCWPTSWPVLEHSYQAYWRSTRIDFESIEDVTKWPKVAARLDPIEGASPWARRSTKSSHHRHANKRQPDTETECTRNSYWLHIFSITFPYCHTDSTLQPLPRRSYLICILLLNCVWTPHCFLIVIYGHHRTECRRCCLRRLVQMLHRSCTRKGKCE